VVVAAKDDLRLEAGSARGAGEDGGGRAAVDALDPGLVGKLAQLDPPPLSKPMCLRQCDVESVVEQVEVLEPLQRKVLDNGKLVDEGQVELAGAQLRDRLLGVELDQADLDLGMAVAEGLDRARHEHGAGCCESPEPQPADPESEQRLQLLLGGGHSRATAWRPRPRSCRGGWAGRGVDVVP
jgi:hypothetical protein